MTGAAVPEAQQLPDVRRDVLLRSGGDGRAILDRKAMHAVHGPDHAAMGKSMFAKHDVNQDGAISNGRAAQGSQSQREFR